ncbi:enoyl-CoA hydratase/isomerase family protein [Roseibium aquae]|uniref:enoyl-CoA hydratase/isomerase family protein n=1 Tax=Roseibium aquae TaxID=1323746 RepID=UPI00123C883A|nr:enoyl-CoA hydratase/isomerase family protein [Roseibium aquae]
MTDEILFEKRGHAGFILLNRPKALNALSHGMVKAMAAQLSLWASDDSIRHVVVSGAGEKAFCAGGDIRAIYEARRAGQTEGLSDFFRDEYRLNAQIKAFPKPYIAVIDGIVMGGGVGVSVHGSHRIGTEHMLFSMPETGIGFFPDVGGTYFLPRLPNAVGTYLAMSAGRMGQADAYEAGILTHATARDRIGDLMVSLERAEDVDALLASVSMVPERGAVMAQADLIDRVFSKETVSGIMAALDAQDDAFAAETAKTIRGKSPTSVHIALEQMRRGRTLDFNGCMRLEFRIVSEILKGHDFFEGVRAVLIDKDHSPKWRPDHLDQVDSLALQAYFGMPNGGDLTL